jgi:hypothetical protein
MWRFWFPLLLGIALAVLFAELPGLQANWVGGMTVPVGLGFGLWWQWHHARWR